MVNDPRRAADLVRGIVRDIGRSRSRADVSAALDEVLPPVQRSLCQVVSFRAGRLLVQVESAPLCAELSGFRREQIRVRLNELLPQQPVAVLQFRLGGTAHV